MDDEVPTHEPKLESLVFCVSNLQDASRQLQDESGLDDPDVEQYDEIKKNLTTRWEEVKDQVKQRYDNVQFLAGTHFIHLFSRIVYAQIGEEKLTEINDQMTQQKAWLENADASIASKEMSEVAVESTDIHEQISKHEVLETKTLFCTIFNLYFFLGS